MSSRPLTTFEMQKYYQNEPKFFGVYSRNSFWKTKDGAYVNVTGNNMIYFDSFGVEHIPKDI